MDDLDFCECPYCENVFHVTDDDFTEETTWITCIVCEEEFDFDLHRVRQMGENFVPIVHISPKHSDTASKYTRFTIGLDDSSVQEHSDQMFSDPQFKGAPASGDYHEHGQVPQYYSESDNILEGREQSIKNDNFQLAPEPISDLSGFKHSQQNEILQRSLEEPNYESEELEDLLQFEKPELIESEFAESSTTEETQNYVQPAEFNAAGIDNDVPHDVSATISSSINYTGDVTGRNGVISVSDDSALNRMYKHKSDVHALIKDRRHPVVTIAWFLTMSGFFVLLAIQFKVFFVPHYSQDDNYRPYLNAFCKVVGCQLPLRRDAYKFTLLLTNIELHPSQPGAVRVTVKMVNDATYAQPYPNLQLTLTDRVGRIVGRRTYGPGLYLSEATGNHIGQGELVSTHLDLARPHEKAVGFVVDIVTDV